MQDINAHHQVQWHRSMADIDQGQWDRLAGTVSTPLLGWQWLHQLEASGSIAPAQGWHPLHLTIWQGGELIAAAPFYIKTHSEGEFVFDHWWAQLAEQFGSAYYPKLVGMSPATPAVGYRFLTAPGVDPKAITAAMLAAVDAKCRQLNLSGSHLLFVDPLWQRTIDADAFITWQHQSYLWRNRDYTSFDEYLQRFRTNQRRNIRRERRSMARQGIRIQALLGDAIPARWADLMYACYSNTNQRYGPWAAKYLNADFFQGLFTHHKSSLLVMAARSEAHWSEPIALSLLLVRGNHLIGRYWGAVRQYKDLHFNMCFYAPIQWAIEHGIETFDPGAGSSHKIYRGFEAVANSSLHRFYDHRIQMLFQNLIPEVNRQEQTHIEALNAHLPFAKPRHVMDRQAPGVP